MEQRERRDGTGSPVLPRPQLSSGGQGFQIFCFCFGALLFLEIQSFFYLGKATAAARAVLSSVSSMYRVEVQCCQVSAVCTGLKCCLPGQGYKSSVVKCQQYVQG